MSVDSVTRVGGSADVIGAALGRDELGDRTRERDRSGVLDALRAVAALMVLCAHSSFVADYGQGDALVTPVRQMLGAGVMLFFALSGYLIAGPSLRALVDGNPLPRTRSYLVRRAARIYPAYWLAFFTLVLILPTPGLTPRRFAIHTLLLQSTWPANAEQGAFYFVAWSLGVEVLFYVFVPVAARLMRARRRRWTVDRLAAVVLVAAAVTALWHVATAFDTRTAPQWVALRVGLQVWLFAFCPGMLVALSAMPGARSRAWGVWRRLTAIPGVAVGLAGVLWVSAYLMETTSVPAIGKWSQPVYAVASGLVLAVVVRNGRLVRRAARVLAPLGLVSYGIYLWHYIVVETLRTHRVGVHGQALAWVLDAVVVFAITVPLATLSWLAVERPAMRWAARRVAARRTISVQGVAAERVAS